MSTRVLFQMCMPGEPCAAGRQQSIRVCYFLAKAGAHVTLHLWTGYFQTPDEALNYFGLTPESNLRIVIHPTTCGDETSRRRIYIAGLCWHVHRLLKLLLTREKCNYDVYFGRGRRYPALHAAFKRLLGYKVLLELHEIVYLDDVPEERLLDVQPRWDLERFAYKHADGVVCITHVLKELAEQKWGVVDPVTVIPSGGIFRASEPRVSGTPLNQIAFVGNPYPFSGVDTLVRAMRHLPDNMRLRIVGGKRGSKDLDRLTRLVHELGLQDRVTLPGFVQPVDLPEEYAKADVLVMPLAEATRTKYFVSPLKLFEYMTARRPIIASDLPTSREILRDGENALLAPSGDPAAIAEAVTRLTEDEALASRIAEEAYRDAQTYAMDEKCRRLYQFIQTLDPNVTRQANARIA